MNPYVKSVQALDDYQLEISFDNGECRIFDAKPFLSRGIFVRLRDQSLFQAVRMVAGSVEWPGGLDLSYETLYHGGHPIAAPVPEAKQSLTPKPNPIAIESIHGVWYLTDSRRPDGSWLLTRGSGNSMGWGQRFEFQANGKFVDSYGARCGNDGQIHHWSGKWTWNNESEVLYAQIKVAHKLGSYTPRIKPTEHDRKGREFYIREVSDEKLVLLPITKETME